MRASAAARQAGYFAAVPDPNGSRTAVEIDFGRRLTEEEYRTAVEALSRADEGETFNGTTMVQLSPARVQIVLNAGVGGEDVVARLGKSAQTALAEQGLRPRTYGYAASTIENFDPASFAARLAELGGVSGAQSRVGDQASAWYGRLAAVSRARGTAGRMAARAGAAIREYAPYLAPLLLADDDLKPPLRARTTRQTPRPRRWRRRSPNDAARNSTTDANAANRSGGA
mgnify:FL=1